MRQKIAAGNWKMNTDVDAGVQLAKEIIKKQKPSDVLTILGVPFTHLAPILNMARYTSDVKLAAQNMHSELKGAYTGEVSVEMLKSLGLEYVILGHSERRQYQQESNAEIAKKIDLALEFGMKPIFCCGEPLEVRKADKQNKHVKKQLKESLFHLSEENIQKVIIAYEPIWAIGTGETASPEQAQQMHLYIRKSLSKKYSSDISEVISILYGGSVKPGNAKELFGQEDIDGGLVGGASLKSKDFLQIINSFS